MRQGGADIIAASPPAPLQRARGGWTWKVAGVVRFQIRIASSGGEDADEEERDEEGVTTRVLS